MKHTVTLTLSDSDIYFLRLLYGKRKTTKPATLVNIAVRRAVAESAKAELAKTGYAPIDDAQPGE